ncbi:MAG: 4Fe-4S binding protein [Candidatus Aenigmatarchaeota archaeon]
MPNADKGKCLRCGGCVAVCPVLAIHLTEHGIEIDSKKCIKCGKCVAFCPVGALKI